MDEGAPPADILAGLIYIACRGNVTTRSMMLASCGRIAVAVGMGALKGMSREMVFVRSGLQLGLISPVNMGHFQGNADGAAEGRGSRDGVGASA